MNTRISLSGEVLEEVESFVYLGSIFNSDGSCTQDVKKRLAMGRSAMQSLSSIWNSKDISTTTEVRLLKALVWPVAIYGSEGWALRSKEEQESCAIAKMTAQFALYMGALKIFGTPDYAHGYYSQHFSWAYVRIDPMNVPTKFEVRSFTCS